MAAAQSALSPRSELDALLRAWENLTGILNNAPNNKDGTTQSTAERQQLLAALSGIVQASTPFYEATGRVAPMLPGWPPCIDMEDITPAKAATALAFAETLIASGALSVATAVPVLAAAARAMPPHALEASSAAGSGGGSGAGSAGGGCGGTADTDDVRLAVACEVAGGTVAYVMASAASAAARVLYGLECGAFGPAGGGGGAG